MEGSIGIFMFHLDMVSDNKWSMRIYDKPLIRLIWIGTIFMILGAIFSIRFKQSKIYE